MRRGPVALGAAVLATALALATPALAARDATPRSLSPGDHTLQLTVGGVARSLIVHVPPQSATTTRPLLLVYHGHGDTAQSTASGTDFEQVANQTNEVVAFLQGIDDAWNDQAFGGGSGRPNDVAFTSAAVTLLEHDVTFDHHRIVAVGFSNGALMVEDLGCKLASTLAMVVPVEGELATTQSKTCAPKRPIDVYEVHGTADTAIPYGGGQFGGPNGPVVLSAPKSVARWAQLDHCDATPSHSNASSTVRLTRYEGCRRKVHVTLRTIIGGVHQWGSNIAEVVHGVLPPA
jgi:polyhydroxybutyrate depolymerase